MSEVNKGYFIEENLVDVVISCIVDSIEFCLVEVILVIIKYFYVVVKEIELI